jgi:hypothetical protein
MNVLLSEQDATGKAKQIYQEIEKSFGMVPNFFKDQAAWTRSGWN